MPTADAKKSKKRKGFRKLIVGLLLGIVCSVGYIKAKSLVIDSLIGLLQEELDGACHEQEQCKISYESASLSLITLTASARNIAVKSIYGTDLHVNKIVASFSLSRVFEKVIPLKLDFFGAHASSVGEDSVTFRYIDYLARPLPPEKQTEDRIRIYLTNLTVADSSFDEPFGETKLSGLGVAMNMERNKDDNFVLFPIIRDLRLIEYGSHENPKQVYHFGTVKSSIELPDDLVLFNTVALYFKHSSIDGAAKAVISKGNELSGDLTLSIDEELLYQTAWLDATFSSRARLSGSLGKPAAEGNFRNKDQSLAHILPGDPPLFSLDDTEGSFRYAFTGKHFLEIPQLSGKGPGVRVQGKQPFILDDDKLSGSFSIALERFPVGPFTLEDIEGTVTITGTTKGPRLIVEGSATQVHTDALTLPALDFTLRQETDDHWLLSLSHDSLQHGSLNGSGQLSFSDAGVQFSKPIAISFKDYHLYKLFPDEEASFLHSITLDGTATVKGSGDIEGINVQAPITVRALHFSNDWALKGLASMNGGILTLDLKNARNSFSIGGDFNLKTEQSPNKLKIRLNELPPGFNTPVNACLNFGLTGDYSFIRSAPLAGTGALSLLTFSVGCAPYTISAIKTETIPIRNGSLHFDSWILQGPESNIVVKGSVNALHGYDVGASGKIQLSGFLPFFPLDDLFGTIDARLTLQGPFDNYVLGGSGTLDQGGLYVERIDLAARDFTGVFEFSEIEASLIDLSGTINGGKVGASGRIDFMQPSLSRFKASAEQLNFEPSEEIQFSVSGNLDLARNELGKLLLAGSLLVDHAVAQKEINIQTILKDFFGYLFKSTPVRRKEAVSKEFEDVLIDVVIQAPRNVFLVSSILAAELSSDMRLSGTLSSPLIKGKLKALSGWFGLKDIKFDITSGEIYFSGTAQKPTVDIVGETTIFDPQSGSVFVIAEARGPLDNPRFSFSSDSGLTHNEILTLLTTGNAIRNRTRINAFSGKQLNSKFFALKADNEDSLTAFFSRLTSIDAVAVDTQTNPQTGVVEPLLQVRKDILENTSLIGESFISGTNTGGRLKVVNSLTDRLSLIGSLDNATIQDSTTLGIDVIYTILADRHPFLKLTIAGNEKISEKEIKQALFLTDESRIPLADLERIKESVLSYYTSLGYFSTEVYIACHQGTELCNELAIGIHEGEESLVDSIILKGDTLPSELNTSLLEVEKDQAATASFRELKREELIAALRNEGYIGARIDSSYQESAHAMRTLELTLTTGRPVTFQFPESTRFTTREFLETINIFKRKQPFGRNTINLLIKEMEKMYRDAGYLYTSISYREQLNESTGRTNYFISIENDTLVPVLGVDFSGNEQLTREHLTDELIERFPKEQEGILFPSVASREKLDQDTFLLEQVYQQLGFPDAKITARIIADEEKPGVRINYEITEGEFFTTRSLVVTGWPDEITLPKRQDSDASIEAVNAYLYILLDTLRRSGFHEPGIRTESFPEHDRMKIVVKPGERTLIQSIIIEGARTIPEENILRRIDINEGDAWDESVFQRNRSRLLKLGLFSRVEFTPVDGALDSALEDLQIKVVERPLDTLEVGGGLNSELGIHLLLEGTDKRLFKDGKTLSISLDTYYNDTDKLISQGTGSLRFVNPYVFDTDIQYISELRFQRLDLATLEFDLNRFTLSNQLLASRYQGFNISLGHSFVFENIDDVPQDAILSDLDSGSVRLSFLTGTLSLDKRDNPINPRSGYFLGLSSNIASELILSEADYMSVTGRGAFVFPLWGPFQINNQSRLGYAWGYNDTREIPITQRFYTGGRNSIRGFRENSLGPRGDDGSVIGGDILVNNNFELRYYIVDSLAMLGFWDTGNTFLESRDDSLRDFRHGLGLGVRYFSPIGPLGIDVGGPLKERPGERSVYVHFNIGTLF